MWHMIGWKEGTKQNFPRFSNYKIMLKVISHTKIKYLKNWVNPCIKGVTPLSLHLSLFISLPLIDLMLIVNDPKVFGRSGKWIVPPKWTIPAMLGIRILELSPWGRLYQTTTPDPMARCCSKLLKLDSNAKKKR